MLKNGSFTEGWIDMPPAPGYLINQQPVGWQLRWLEPGESLFGANDRAKGIPECVHKLEHQLPAHEHRGAKGALILEGDTTYKIFHATSSFGAELTQTVSGLQPGSTARLIFPILVVLHGETDPYGAESGVWINGEGHWVHGHDMGDRRWYRHQKEITIPASGVLNIAVRVKSKWNRPKDFFLDGFKLEAATVQPTATVPSSKSISISVPQGMQVVTAAGDEPGVIVVTVPPGVNVNVR